MSVRAYILLNIEAGHISSVIDEVSKIEEVVEAYPITGDYDAIACIEVDDVANMKKAIADSIQNIKGVKKSTTHVAFK